MKSVEMRIDEIQRRVDELKAQERKLQAQKKEADRKARTKRLITIGAAVESVLGYSLPQGEPLDRFLDAVRHYIATEHLSEDEQAGEVRHD